MSQGWFPFLVACSRSKKHTFLSFVTSMFSGLQSPKAILNECTFEISLPTALMISLSLATLFLDEETIIRFTISLVFSPSTKSSKISRSLRLIYRMRGTVKPLLLRSWLMAYSLSRRVSPNTANDCVPKVHNARGNHLKPSQSSNFFTTICWVSWFFWRRSRKTLFKTPPISSIVIFDVSPPGTVFLTKSSMLVLSEMGTGPRGVGINRYFSVSSSCWSSSVF